jgi:hypothetical protein
MRNLWELEVYRRRGAAIKEQFGWEGDESHGAFVVPSCIDKAPLAVIASGSDGWDHVSVSRKNRCPSWLEMEQIKHLFFKSTETAMQLHVPVSDHINNAPTCLHLWRPHNSEIPRPPSIMVGESGKPLQDRAEALAMRKRIMNEK